MLGRQAGRKKEGKVKGGRRKVKRGERRNRETFEKLKEPGSKM